MADPDPDPLPDPEDPNPISGPTLDALLHAVYCLPTRHPFQFGRALGTTGPHEVVHMGNETIIRLDMPGAFPSEFTRTNIPESNRISFRAIAPGMGMDPYDEPAREYAGFLQLPNGCDPTLINIIDNYEDGSFFLGFLNSTVKPSIFGLPKPKIPPPPPPVRKGQVVAGSSSESGRGFEDFDYGCPEAIYERANNQPEASTSAPSGRKTRKSRQTRQPAVEEPPSKSCKTQAWVRAFLARNLFGVNVPDPPKDEPPVVLTPSVLSRHGAPGTAIGAVVKYHSPMCSCASCKPDWYVEILTTTKDIVGYDTTILFRGPLGVCEKRLIQEKDGSYALYVRADLPGLPPKLCKVDIQDRRVVVFGRQAGDEVKLLAPRAYFFFVQLECSCFKFIGAVHAGFSRGILRILCKIIPAYADEKDYDFP